MHFGFTTSEVSLKYELNLEARLNIEGKALSNNENYNGLYIKILRLKNRINCLLRASFVNTFGLGTQHVGSGNKLVYSTLIFS